MFFYSIMQYLLYLLRSQNKNKKITVEESDEWNREVEFEDE